MCVTNTLLRIFFSQRNPPIGSISAKNEKFLHLYTTISISVVSVINPNLKLSFYRHKWVEFHIIINLLFEFIVSIIITLYWHLKLSLIWNCISRFKILESVSTNHLWKQIGNRSILYRRYQKHQQSHSVFILYIVYLCTSNSNKSMLYLLVLADI